MALHLGNVPASTTLYIPFATYDSNGASVTMSNFAVGDIQIYKNGSVTQRSSTSGFTLLDTDGIDFDTNTGIHGFSIDLSDNTDAGFYAVGSFYWVVVASVTVSTQTVNLVAATFRIVAAENTSGYPLTDTAKINNVSTSSVTTINANVGTTQPINFTGTGASAFAKSDVVDIAGSAVSTSTAQLGVNVVNAGGTAWASGSLTSGVFAAGAINAAAIADAAIDRATFAADTGLQTIRSNTAQAGAASTITLDASASATDNFYAGDLVYLTGGTGVGQYRLINSYVGTTKVATVTPAWATNPDVTSTFAIVPRGSATIEALERVAPSTHAAGMFPSDLRDISGSAVSTSTAQLGVNVVNFGGSAGTFASGIPSVDAAKINGVSTSSVTTVNANVGTTQPINFTGTGVSALAKTDVVDFGGAAGTFSSGIPSVNASKINGVATTSVTAVNANLGTTDVVNFTGTGASALVKSDMVDVAGSAVSASTAQLGVNVVNFGGSAGTFAAGIPAVNTTKVGGTAQTAGDLAALISALNNLSASEVFTTQMTESYNTDGAAPTLAQALHLIIAFLMEKNIAGTTLTAKKLDGTTTAATFTLDDGTSPTSITRAT